VVATTRLERKGSKMAESVKKGARITGADRAKLTGEPTEEYADGTAPSERGGVPDEAASAPVPEDLTREESRLDTGSPT
jgi:hypothetical protein